MLVRAGTSGYSYKEWLGSFYPEGLPQKRMLAYYAERLPCVELNNTFYRMPTAAAIAGWCDEVGPEFRFFVKASRRISHLSRLKDVAEPVAFLKDRLSHFGERLGGVLVQLPPNFKLNQERLETFLELWGPTPALAMEFRHETWFTSEVSKCLHAHGATLVLGDHLPPAAELLPGAGSAPLTFARLRAESYEPEELAQWHARLRLTGAEHAYVFFKHEVEGPAFAERFNKLAE